MRCGLLGEKLSHSYSPQIHAQLAAYDYRLYEVAPEALEDFLLHGEWDGLNVTIPYKKAVLPYCASLSETARRIGSVNTLVRRKDGIFGENTDAYGFSETLRASGISVSGKKAIVLGSGGASVMVCDVLRSLGASVTVISRSGADNYGNLDRHADAQLIVNATPVGTYPNNGISPVDLGIFPQCEAVFDLIYNPARTALLLQAERLGIAGFNGLKMLVAQAKRSAELFTGSAIDDAKIETIEAALSAQMRNIVLIGMPGCGKSAVGKALAEKTGKAFFDADAELVKAAGKTIPEIFAEDGEAEFRRMETETLCLLGKKSGAVIATGGGCVTVARNYDLLHQNGKIVWLKRSLDALPKDGRPLSQKTDLQAMYEKRRGFYEAFSDAAVSNDGELSGTVKAVLEVL